MNFSLEQKILATFIQDRKAFDAVQDITQSSDFSEVGKIILAQVTAYYEKDKEISAIDRTVLNARLQRKYKKQADTLVAYVESLAEGGSTTNILEELLDQRKMITEARLGNILLNPTHSDYDVRQGIESWLQIEDTRTALTVTEQDLSDQILSPTIDQLCSGNQYQILPFFPGSLNRLTGGIARGFHVVIFARPETGKTGFVINLASALLLRGYKICHVGNEEDIMLPFSRYLARLGEQPFTLSTIQERKTVQSILDTLKEPLSRLLVKRLNPGTERELRKILEEFQPDVLIVDQMINLNEKTQEGLAKSSSMLRRLGGEYGVVVVSVTQAGENASGKIFLNDHHIFMNKTAVYGDADILIGLGANPDYIAMDKMQVNVLKNKLNPQSGHGSITVHVDRATGKLVSI